MTSRHSPPAVRHPLSRPAGLAVVLVLAWLLAAALLLGWALQVQASMLQRVAALLAAMAAAAGLLHGWRRLGQGQLAWDGEHWWWHGCDARDAVCPVAVQVWADGGRWLWVQARTAGAGPGPGGRWLLLRERQSPESWGELRRAVYSPARPSDRPQ